MDAWMFQNGRMQARNALRAVEPARRVLLALKATGKLDCCELFSTAVGAVKKQRRNGAALQRSQIGERLRLLEVERRNGAWFE
jgi:hypothetical protein